MDDSRSSRDCDGRRRRIIPSCLSNSEEKKRDGESDSKLVTAGGRSPMHPRAVPPASHHCRKNMEAPGKLRQAQQASPSMTSIVCEARALDLGKGDLGTPPQRSAATQLAANNVPAAAGQGRWFRLKHSRGPCNCHHQTSRRALASFPVVAATRLSAQPLKAGVWGRRYCLSRTVVQPFLSFTSGTVAAALRRLFRSSFARQGNKSVTI